MIFVFSPSQTEYSTHFGTGKAFCILEIARYFNRVPSQYNITNMAKLLKRDYRDQLDIDIFKSVLDELMECYRQALHAVELLPGHGAVPINELHSEISKTIKVKGKKVLRISKRKIIKPDWASSRFAVRSIARMYLRSHIRSKLGTIANRLEIEYLGYRHNETNASERLDTIIKKLRDYNERFATKKSVLPKLAGWLWAIFAPLFTTYLSRFVLPHLEVSMNGILVQIATYMILLGLMVGLPLYFLVVLGGFRWKRLILLGQTGDVDVKLAAFLRWTRAPLANAYQSENRVFEILSFPKPREFPWDQVLSPDKVWAAFLSFSMLLILLATLITVNQSNWVALLIIMALTFFSVWVLSHFFWNPISKTMKQRIQSSTC